MSALSPTSKFYHFMAKYPVPFLIVIPVLLITFTFLGFSQPDRVEDKVSNLWIPTSTSYYHDKEYAKKVSSMVKEENEEESDADGIRNTFFAAMAVSRDGENLFTKNRLKEITSRMEETERNTKVEHNGNTFTWDDVCSSNNAGIGTTYKFPCFRLSPVDYFRESRWFFDTDDRLTWHDRLIHTSVVKPRVPRVGVMQASCTSLNPKNGLYNETNPGMCDHEYRVRTDRDYVMANNYPLETLNPLKLFSDVGDFEENLPCKICIESAYEKTIDLLESAASSTFTFLEDDLKKLVESLQEQQQQQQQQQQNATNVFSTESSAMLQQASVLLELVIDAKGVISRGAVEEFYLYYVRRSFYSEFGAQALQSSYSELMQPEKGPFNIVCSSLNMTCPTNLTLDQAKDVLLNHADNQFSSINTVGLPFPFWNEDSGFMFDMGSNNTTSSDDLKPFGGSGLDLSGGPTKGTEAGGRPGQGSIYFDLENFGTEKHNPLYAPFGDFNPFDGTPDDEYFGLVLHDPIFVWFTAAVTPMAGDCGNDPIPGTREKSQISEQVLSALSPKDCTPYHKTNQTWYSKKLDFAKLWYDLIMDSDGFLAITKGVDDPYTWTSGQSCSYGLQEKRFSYINASDEEILKEASKELYYIDEGASMGVLDRNLLMGDTQPSINEIDYDTNPLTHVGMIQMLYPTLIPNDIVKKVRNCNRPGGPINDLSIEDAKEILFQFKESFEENWSKGWHDDGGEGRVQFVGIFDDGGVPGTTGRMLKEITTNGGALMAISFAIIAVFSVLFLGSHDVITSKILITMIGVILVIMSFFGAIGLAILFGIKINISIGWTLPFIIIGLGVDDMYIVSLSLKNRNGYKLDDFVSTMKEVLIPVTMTSLVNLCMFGIMNICDIPAVYKTAQAAMICVVMLYITILFSFPAYCWLDMKRQNSGRMDVLFCTKSKNTPVDEIVPSPRNADMSPKEHQEDDEMVEEPKKMGLNSDKPSREEDFSGNRGGILYNQVYKPLMIQDGMLRWIMQAMIWLTAACLLGISIYGCTQTEFGVGLEDFFPQNTQAGAWAKYQTEHLASMSVNMNWGDIDYKNPYVQLKMIKQFESVISTPHVVSEVDTKQLWIADLALWTTRQCSENFLKMDASTLECGRDQRFQPNDGSNITLDCSGGWRKNTLGLRNKMIDNLYDDKCEKAYDRGICRPTNQMHHKDLEELAAKGLYDPITDMDASWCPVFEGWTEDQMQFCVEKWRFYSGGAGNLLVEPNTATEAFWCPGDFFSDDSIVSPIPISSGPSLFGINLLSHSDILDLIAETRSFCDNDDDDEVKCWMSGAPYDYWEQYTYVDTLLYEIVGSAVAIGFAVAGLFFLGKFLIDKEHSMGKAIIGSFVCSFIIALWCALSTIVVIGLSSLASVSLTAFSDMAFVLSIGFVVEYTVHITHRFLTAPMHLERARDRVEYSMEFLFLPTFMSFVSSTIGVACLAFTDFKFNEIFFFRPLMIVMVVTYFFGCFFLPAVLSLLDFEFLKLGPQSHSFNNVRDFEEGEE